jgi:hypothetical protein
MTISRLVMVAGGHQEIFSVFCFLAYSSLPALRTLELCLKHYDVDKALFEFHDRQDLHSDLTSAGLRAQHPVLSSVHVILTLTLDLGHGDDGEEPDADQRARYNEQLWSSKFMRVVEDMRLLTISYRREGMDSGKTAG